MENLNKGEIIIYKSDDGSVSLDVKLEQDTIWLTQDMIVKLFDSSKANISEHISHIFQDEELDKISTVRKFRTVRKEGGRNVSRELEYYSLDMIIAVGYRVNSKKATQFRIWATNVLRDYLTKGYAVNEKLLHKKKRREKFLPLFLFTPSPVSGEDPDLIDLCDSHSWYEAVYERSGCPARRGIRRRAAEWPDSGATSGSAGCGRPRRSPPCV